MSQSFPTVKLCDKKKTVGFVYPSVRQVPGTSYFVQSRSTQRPNNNGSIFKGSYLSMNQGPSWFFLSKSWFILSTMDQVFFLVGPSFFPYYFSTYCLPTVKNLVQCHTHQSYSTLVHEPSLLNSTVKLGTMSHLHVL